MHDTPEIYGHVIYLVEQGPTNLESCRNHLKILSAKRVTWSKFHAEDPQILGATVQNLAALAIWRPVFLYPCCWIFPARDESIQAEIGWGLCQN
jgi:hypothetical protein